MNIILGSSSVYRRNILTEAGITFEVIRPDINEDIIRTVNYEHTPVILSYAKARAVAEKVNSPTIIIACDQVVICNGNILEKPKDADEVRAWYKLYREYPVNYINGVTVLNTETMASLTAQDISVAVLKEIPTDFTEDQIAKGIIFNCSGGIGDETHDTYATITEGSRQSVMGLPIELVMGMIEKLK